MLGASGAVGTEALNKLIKLNRFEKITLLGRTPLSNIKSNSVFQHKIDIFSVSSYTDFLHKHDTAICTLGVGEPSKVNKEVFIKIDKTAVLDFGIACKKAGVNHFELLSSVGINSSSSSFYLRTKGELVEELKKLEFERLSIFKPSMILTPENRYGILQGITLKVWPWLNPVLIGSLRKYRGVSVERLGSAMAVNIYTHKVGFETLEWDYFNEIVNIHTKIL